MTIHFLTTIHFLMTIHFSMTAYFLDNFIFDDNFIFGRLTPESLRLRKSAGLRPGTAEGGRPYAGIAESGLLWALFSSIRYALVDGLAAGEAFAGSVPVGDFGLA